MRPIVLILALCTLAALALPAVSPRPPAAAAASDTTTVSILSEKAGFRPATVAVQRGGTVTWRNADAMPHNVVVQNGAAASPVLTRGQSYSRVFTKSGTYRYYCGLHPRMKGTIVVR